MKQYIIPILALFLINVAFAESYETTFQFNPDKTYNAITNKTLETGDNVIDFEGVEYVCESTCIPQPRAEPCILRQRIAPQGDFKTKSTCIRESQQVVNTCAEFKTTVTKDEIDPKCWKGKLKINGNTYNLNYNETLKINDYLSFSYTTDAVYKKYKTGTSELGETIYKTGVYPRYNVFFNMNMDVDKGLNTSIKANNLTKDTTVEITYNNKILSNIGGGIEFVQNNYLFFLTSTITDLKQTFKSGLNTKQEETTSVLGNKELTITPYITIKEYYNGKLTTYKNIAGESKEINTKLYKTIDTTNMERYNLKSTPQESKSLIQKFNDWINSLFE